MQEAFSCFGLVLRQILFFPLLPEMHDFQKTLASLELLFHGLFYHYFVFVNIRAYLPVFTITCETQNNEKTA